MIFEFQHRLPTGSWQKLGTARTPGDRFDIEEAAVAFRAAKGGSLPEGKYRVRAVEADSRWRVAEVDEHGVIRGVEQ